MFAWLFSLCIVAAGGVSEERVTGKGQLPCVRSSVTLFLFLSLSFSPPPPTPIVPGLFLLCSRRHRSLVITSMKSA